MTRFIVQARVVVVAVVKLDYQVYDFVASKHERVHNNIDDDDDDDDSNKKLALVYRTRSHKKFSCEFRLC